MPLRWLAWVPAVFAFVVVIRRAEWRPDVLDAVQPWAAGELRRNRTMVRRVPVPRVPPLLKMLC